jgi:hypothetical protein
MGSVGGRGGVGAVMPPVYPLGPVDLRRHAARSWRSGPPAEDRPRRQEREDDVGHDEQ